MVPSCAVVLIGLTGGIGAGKSTVSAALAERGAVVIDADLITRELQEPGQPVLEAMVEHFGPSIVGPDGRLLRQAVADLVFNDAEALKALNGIVHPAVGAEIAERLGREAGERPRRRAGRPAAGRVGSRRHGRAARGRRRPRGGRRAPRRPAWVRRGGRPRPHRPSGLPRGTPGPGRLRDPQRRHPRRARTPDRRRLEVDRAASIPNLRARSLRSWPWGSTRARTACHSSRRGYMSGSSSGRMRLSLAR